ncbi:MAG: hypothetical protein KKF56_04050 [Nanoarchaeota archaeon]|nr:hypothetical protein [Nanoarchaeota archaeon]
MPHQCVHCSEIYADASKELLEGCSCGGRFFYYIKQEKADKLKNSPLIELEEKDKKQVEKDVREMIGEEDEEVPIVLDLESVRILEPGKYEIDISRVFDTNRPVVYKLQEGKYIIDLSSTIKGSLKELKNKIRKPVAKKRGKKKR